MKNLIVLLIALLLFGFGISEGSKMALKATKIQPIGADKCNVSLELHNNSGRKINYLSMYCSDEGFYVTDNPDVIVVPKPCDKNFPKSVMIAKNSYRTADLQLEVLKKAKEAKFKIGFKFIEIPNGIALSAFDSSKVESVTIWSNVIEFKR
ncbi:hypothetical protein [Flavobacterium sp.]